MDLVAENKRREALGMELKVDPNAGKSGDNANGGNQDDSNKGKNPADAGNTTDAAKPIELTDDAVLEYLKKKGVEADSLDAFLPKPKEKTPEEKEQERQMREARKLTFGIEKGYFKKEQYDQFVHDKQSVTDVVFNEYKEQAKADDPELTDIEIEEEFQERFGLNADQATRAYKRGQKELAIQGEKLLKTKYDKLYQVDGDFEAHETAETTKKQHEDNIISKAPQYKKDVEDIAVELRKQKFSIGEKEGEDTYDFEYTDDSINAAKKVLLETKFSRERIERGWTKEELKNILDTVLFAQNKTKILSKVAKDYYSSELNKKNKDRHGIFPDRDVNLRQNSEAYDEATAYRRKALGMSVEADSN